MIGGTLKAESCDSKNGRVTDFREKTTGFCIYIDKKTKTLLQIKMYVDKLHGDLMGSFFQTR